MENTPKQVLRALEQLGSEHSPRRREDVLKAGMTEMIRWFTLAAKIILQRKIQLPKQTQTLMTKHKEALKALADEHVPLPEKRKLILKPGGSGFLGGVMIRSLLRWDGVKTVRKFTKSTPKKKGTKKKPKTLKKKKKSLLKIDDRFITQRRNRPVPIPSSPPFVRLGTPRTPSPPTPQFRAVRLGTPIQRSATPPMVSRFTPLPSMTTMFSQGPVSSAANTALDALRRRLHI
jgi:hypothetical protein